MATVYYKYTLLLTCSALSLCQLKNVDSQHARRLRAEEDNERRSVSRRSILILSYLSVDAFRRFSANFSLLLTKGNLIAVV